ncbi:16S rRNA (uracil(1498)-N(3))-methyltransferase [Helicobacter cinaedi]|uniref:16S rRNA (uracil(1498)-N(3))-methyltransferase n=1 Tax=Helicobacter cinaedi TaxID=213 RepID=UPI000CF1C3FA|nr:16S rRNA (uracil(1498)-N(3))-methyltransferase [Helicobacter cinaedi]
MQFLYQPNAGDFQVEISDDDFTYLIKARRFGVDSVVKMRNLKDKKLYTYAITEIKKKSALLTKISEQDSQNSHSSPLHLLWAIIDPKVIEKTLPFLNELGIARISFFYAEFSQRQFSLNLQRMQKILISSSQQCGRIDLMELEVLKDFDSICERYAPFYAFDFGGMDIREHNPFKQDSKSLENASVRVMVGAEGGFSQRERQRFAKIITLNDTLILRSESASVFLASLARLATTAQNLRNS